MGEEGLLKLVLRRWLECLHLGLLLTELSIVVVQLLQPRRNFDELLFELLAEV